MSDQADNITLEKVFTELKQLRTDLGAANVLEESSIPPWSTSTPYRLGVFFDRIEGQRKPYLMAIDGIVKARLKLSPIRAAIFMVLFLDLQDRLEGGRGVVDFHDSVAKAYEILEPDPEKKEIKDSNLRVSVHRFELSLSEDKDLSNNDYSTNFNAKLGGFEVRDRSSQDITPLVNIQVTAADTQLSELLESVCSSSLISRVLKRRALYIPSGSEGTDKFLLEMYSHEDELNVTSLYMRPPFTSYPVELLESVGVSNETIVRKLKSIAGYKSGNFNFLEILSKETITDLIRYCPENGFKFYPKHINANQVAEHIACLMKMLESYSSFNLYVTESPVPFVLVTYNLIRKSSSDYFTVFFQPFSTTEQADLSCFVVADTNVYRSMHQNVIEWVVRHPSTIRRKSDVISYLGKVRERLLTRGPLAMKSAPGDSLQI